MPPARLAAAKRIQGSPLKLFWGTASAPAGTEAVRGLISRGYQLIAVIIAEARRRAPSCVNPNRKIRISATRNYLSGQRERPARLQEHQRPGDKPINIVGIKELFCAMRHHA